MANGRDIERRPRAGRRASWRSVAIGALVLACILGAAAPSRQGAADDRCLVSPIFDLPAQLSTPEGLRDQEGAHLIGRWAVDEGAIEVWLIVAESRISEAFLTLSRRQLKRATGALPKDVANCIKVMASVEPSMREAGGLSWIVPSAHAAATDGSYRIVRSCPLPASKAGPRSCYYALERRESNVWRGLAVYAAPIGR